MSLLVDTHIVIWSALAPERLSRSARRMLDDARSDVWFSVVNLWEVAIKRALRRGDFDVDPRRLRRGLLEHGWRELGVSGEHVLAIEGLPPIHRDPFDRMLLAQAHIEGLTLITTDKVVARYPGQVRKV